MGAFNQLPEYFAKDLKDWRRWLKRHHARSPGVWLIFYRKSTGVACVSYSDSVDEALCWGWIDSLRQKLDDTRYRQVFCPRKPGSVWSAVNKGKIEAMIAAGRMQPAGLAKIDAAKADGSWTKLDSADNHEIPDDLQAAFDANPVIAAGYQALTPGRRKTILYWMAAAKREQTRQARIRQIFDAISSGKMPGG